MPDRALRVERRADAALALRLAVPAVAIGATLVLGGLLFAALGEPPLTLLWAFFAAPLTSAYGLGEMLVKAVPLAVVALGLSIGFRAGVWNIGAEGQLILGAIAAGAVGLFIPLGALTLPVMLTAGAAAGLTWASIAALLRARLGTNEILVTLMLSYVAALLLSWLVHGPWRDPAGFNYPQSALLPAQAMMAPLHPAHRVTASVFVAIAAAAATWLLMERSMLGYRLAVGGAAPPAARYAGFGERGAVWTGLLAGGGAAGLVGAMELAGPLGQLTSVVSPGYGFAAIIVAFVGRLHALGIVLAALVMALLYLGGESVQVTHGIPAAVTRVLQGTLLLSLLAANWLLTHRVVRAERATERVA